MSPSDIHFEEVPASGASTEVPMNQLAENLEFGTVYAFAHGESDGLTWAHWGGCWGGFDIAEDDLTLVDNEVNYITVAIATGAIGVQAGSDTVNWYDTTNYVRVYEVTVAGGVVTDVVDHRAGPGGAQGYPKFIAPRIASTTSASAPTPDASTTDVYILTALATDPTFGAPTGTPVQYQPLFIRIKDNATPRTLAWNAIYRSTTNAALPTTTTASRELHIAFAYDATANKWDCVGTTEVV